MFETCSLFKDHALKDAVFSLAKEKCLYFVIIQCPEHRI